MEKLWWWSLARVKSQLAGTGVVLPVSPFARVAWQRPTSVTLKDKKLAALLGKAAGGSRLPPCRFSGRWWFWAAAHCSGPMVSPTPPEPRPRSRPRWARHQFRDPPQCMPGLETADCRRRYFLYQRRYPYVDVPYLRTWQCWPPTPCDEIFRITNSRSTRSVAPRLHQPVGMAPLANCAIHACSFRLACLGGCTRKVIHGWGLYAVGGEERGVIPRGSLSLLFAPGFDTTPVPLFLNLSVSVGNFGTRAIVFICWP
jgi:hypothetical protein